MDHSDRDWEAFGRSNPYWAVLTEPRYRSGSLTPDGLADFMASGQQHLDWLFDAIHAQVSPGFAPQRALDFGCGVGRVLLPLARRCKTVYGVDVSPSMLAEAERNCRAAGLPNVRLLLAESDRTELPSPVDFIHSYIVLQHVPVARGERITRHLLRLLEPGGIGALHFTYSVSSPLSRRLLAWARLRIPLANPAINLALGRRPTHPIMHVHEYSMSRVLGMLQDAGCSTVVSLFTDHGGNRGAMLLLQKATEGS